MLSPPHAVSPTTSPPLDVDSRSRETAGIRQPRQLRFEELTWCVTRSLRMALHREVVQHHETCAAQSLPARSLSVLMPTHRIEVLLNRRTHLGISSSVVCCNRTSSNQQLAKSQQALRLV